MPLRTLTGDPVETICGALAADTDVDLAVVGARGGLSGPLPRFEGSNSKRWHSSSRNARS